MPYDTRDMLKLAIALTATPVPGVADETRWRAAVGRAYYACWLTARDRLFSVEGMPTRSQKNKIGRKPPGSHWEVINGLGANEAMDRGRRKVQRDQLQTLKAMREAADYRNATTHAKVRDLFRTLDVATWEELADECLALASQVLPDMERVPRFQ